MDKVPKNVMRSKMLIKNALLKLMEKKSPIDIKITEITSLANVNRGTFYAHYNNIYEVINELEDDLLDKFFLPLETSMQPTFEDVRPVLMEIITATYKNRKYFQKNSYVSIFPSLNRKCKERVYELLQSCTLIDQTPESAVQNKINVSYFTSGYIGILYDWLDGILGDLPVEELLSYMEANIKTLEFN